MKESHPNGTIVECVKFIDVHTSIPAGTRGVVKAVDDVGTVFVKWDIGNYIGMIPGEDEWKIINEVKE